MDFYPYALYAHFIALVAAVVGATILHFNVSRLRGAVTLADARSAAGVIRKAAMLMPIFAIALLATGFYLVQLRWPMRSGWIIAGIVGLISMPIASILTLKPRLAAIGMKLGAAGDGMVDDALRAQFHHRAISAGMAFNHVIALAIMLVMVIKPSLGGSLAVLATAPVAALWAWFAGGAAPEVTQATGRG